MQGIFKNKNAILNFFILLFSLSGVYAQSETKSNGVLSGVIVDSKSKESLVGVTVILIGTYKGGVTDLDGKYIVDNIKPGDYSIKINYIGYAERIYNGIRIKSNETTVLNIALTEISQTLEAVEVVGEKNLVNLESGKSEVKITAEEIKEMNTKDVKEIVAMQNGVSQNPDGLQIRGGRVYETQYVVDGINAQDPLSGTGFGVNVSSNSIANLNVITGGGDAEFGDGSSGIILTNIKEGSQKLSVVGKWQRDNLGFNNKQSNKTGWNTDIVSIDIGAPIPKTHRRATIFVGSTMNVSNDYFGSTANQLKSSLFDKSTLWAPRYDNQWSNTLKLAFRITETKKITLTNQHSISVNQNTRALQIIGNDVVVQPGYQYRFSENLDNAATYTARTNLTALNYTDNINEHWRLDVTVGRLFTALRADANGRPFREQTVDKEYDPNSIVTNPITLYNPNDEVVYINPGSGLVNNGGIATIWHDHYVQEYTTKLKLSYIPNNKFHFYSFGLEHKEQEYQWIDVTKPWVGAPIKINDSVSTPSTRVGQTSDVWKVRPATGGIFFQDEIRYEGIIANIGLRYNYWAPGKFADDIVADANSTILDATREDYNNNTWKNIDGRRYKHRLLPKIRVSFPVRDNHVLYFNYGHSMRLPHPRFVYAGLDPVYQDRGFLSNIGNLDLNPEVTVAYEIGLKSQITKDFATTITAFYNDKYDYIVTRTAEVKDQTGRFVPKTFYINQDYARIQGLEVGLMYRISKMLRANLNLAYQIATGKSNSATESKLQIQQNGYVSTSKEQYLAWDRPLDIKAAFTFKPDSTIRIGRFSFNNFRFFISSTYKSGLRYTPYRLSSRGVTPTGRPEYEEIQDQQFSKVGKFWSWTDIRITRDIHLKKAILSFSFEIKNIFNQKNAQIVNPVTGRGYEYGDALPSDQRDPLYPHPQDSGIPPFDPARYMQPRQIIYGISFEF